MLWVLAGGVLSGCTKKRETQVSLKPTSKTLQDDTAHQLTFKHQPQRVVSVAPSLTEIICAIGAESQLVGVSQFSDYPESITQLPKVGSYVRPGLEHIIALNPDLVVLVYDGPSYDVVNTLRSVGLSVAVLRSRNFSDILKNIHWLSRALGHSEEGNRLAQRLKGQYEAVRQLVQDLPKPRVLYAITIDPIMTVGGNSFINKLITDAGGHNIAGDIRQAYPRLSLESIISLAPEVLLFSYGMGSEPAMEAQLKFWKKWPEIPAVKEKRFIEIDPDIIDRAGPRIIQGLATLAIKLHPEKESEITQIMKDVKP